MKKLRSLGVALALLLAATTVFAGDRAVTVKLRSGETVHGTLKGIADGVYTVESASGVRALPEGEIERIDFDGKGPASARPGTVSLAFANAPVRDVVAAIASAADAPVLVDADVDEKVSITVVGEPWRIALDRIAALNTSVSVLALRDGALVVQAPPRITMEFTDANVRAQFQLLGAYSGRNVVLDAGVRGDATVNIHGETFAHAMRSLAGSVGCVVERKGDTFGVHPKGTHPFGREDLELAEWPAALASGATPPARVNLAVNAAPLSEVVATVARAAGVSIAVDPSLVARPVTLTARSASWRDVLAFLARGGELRVRDEGSLGLRLEARPRSAIGFGDADVRDAIPLLAARAGINLVLGRGPMGNTTLDVHGFYDEALEAVAYASRVGCTWEGPIMLRVAPPEGFSDTPSSSTTAPGPLPPVGSRWRLEALRDRMRVVGTIEDPDAGSVALVRFGFWPAPARHCYPGKPVHDAEGRQIPGLTVTKIEATSVVFVCDGKEFTLERHGLDTIPADSDLPASELATQLEALVAEIEKAASAHDGATLEARFRDFEGLVERYERVPGADRGLEARWQERVVALTETRLTLTLLRTLDAATVCLQDLIRATKEGRDADAKACAKKLNRIFYEAPEKPETVKEFIRAGDVVLAKAKAVLAEAAVEAAAKEVDALIATLEKRASDGTMDVEWALGHTRKIVRALDRYRSAPGMDQARIAKWDERLVPFAEIRLAVALESAITAGNDLLKQMVRAQKAARPDEVKAGYEKVEALVETMKEEDREEFHRNGDAILSRARAILDETLGKTGETPAAPLGTNQAKPEDFPATFRLYGILTNPDDSSRNFFEVEPRKTIAGMDTAVKHWLVRVGERLPAPFGAFKVTRVEARTEGASKLAVVTIEDTERTVSGSHPTSTIELSPAPN